MALGIDGASIGYDQNNMQSTLNRIENDCVNQAKQSLRNQISQLRDEVHNCWVGKSADTFMDNMQHDVDEICKGLDAAFDGLKAEFEKIVAGLAEIDQELIQKR